MFCNFPGSQNLRGDRQEFCHSEHEATDSNLVCGSKSGLLFGNHQTLTYQLSSQKESVKIGTKSWATTLSSLSEAHRRWSRKFKGCLQLPTTIKKKTKKKPIWCFMKEYEIMCVLFLRLYHLERLKQDTMGKILLQMNWEKPKPSSIKKFYLFFFTEVKTSDVRTFQPLN